MALPDNSLSSEYITSPFLGSRNLTASKEHDYETGGIALSDPSQGHMVQVWEAEIRSASNIVLRNEQGYITTYYVDTNITDVSLTFDQNMRPTIALVSNGQAKLIWYDSTAGAEVVTILDADVVSPKVSLDDKRTPQMGANDIILGYFREADLYFRMQRDRYKVEYLLATDILPQSDWYLRRIGLNTVNRFQFEIGTWGSQEGLIAALLAQAPDPYSNVAPPYQVSGTTATAFPGTTGDSTIYSPDNDTSQE